MHHHSSITQRMSAVCKYDFIESVPLQVYLIVRLYWIIFSGSVIVPFVEYRVSLWAVVEKKKHWHSFYFLKAPQCMTDLDA